VAFSTNIRMSLNRLLKPVNLKLSTLLADNAESSRIKALEASGLLERPVYSLLPGMANFDAEPLAKAYSKYRAEIERLRQVGKNDVGYVFANDYFSSPDMEVLYLLMRTLMPSNVVEVGCGNSTRISRQAIIDGDLKTKIIAIDPHPRNDIALFVDEFRQCKLEHIENYEIFQNLQPGDFLFIDSSHQVHVGNDVARIFCDIIPRLKAGVVIHIHDIFLPYEYPPAFAYDYSNWGEQYLLHALMQGRPCEILWPGYYLQKSRPELAKTLPFLSQGRAQSFWLLLK